MTFLLFSRCESQGHVVKNEVKDFLAKESMFLGQL